MNNPLFKKYYPEYFISEQDCFNNRHIDYKYISEFLFKRMCRHNRSLLNDLYNADKYHNAYSNMIKSYCDKIDTMVKEIKSMYGNTNADADKYYLDYIYPTLVWNPKYHCYDDVG